MPEEGRGETGELRTCGFSQAGLSGRSGKSHPEKRQQQPVRPSTKSRFEVLNEESDWSDEEELCGLGDDDEATEMDEGAFRRAIEPFNPDEGGGRRARIWTGTDLDGGTGTNVTTQGRRVIQGRWAGEGCSRAPLSSAASPWALEWPGRGNSGGGPRTRRGEETKGGEGGTRAHEGGEGTARGEPHAIPALVPVMRFR